MEYILTNHQQEVGNAALNKLRNGCKRLLLKGSAGCGKTVLASWLVDQARKDRTINARYNNGTVFVTAPTNKALAVLQSKIHLPVEFKTIHSALKLRRIVDGRTGIESYVRSSGGYISKRQDEFLNCRLAIIDECSMLSAQFIGGKLDYKGQFWNGYIDDLDIPIVMIGDEKQLNPVGEEHSPAFHQKWDEVELTEIIRQGAGNPIIELSRDLDMIYFKIPNVIDGKGYIYDNNKGGLIDSLAEANGTDELKYLSWANKDVDEMNFLVRQRRYGNPRKIELEETLVFNSPFGEFYTNQEVKVEEVDIYVDEIGIPRHDTKWDSDGQPISQTDKIKVKFYRINNAIDVIHEDSAFVVKTIADSIIQNCKIRGWDWRGKFWFLEQFADIKYNHALTIHKSQGSTYRQTIVNIGNVDFNKNAIEKQRMLYTAVTRASDLLILYNVK